MMTYGLPSYCAARYLALMGRQIETRSDNAATAWA